MTAQPKTDYQVFISYSSQDRSWAEGACSILERRRVRCWIAPRDIEPGTEWGAAIIAGIDRCRVMLLIFSAQANESGQVRREVERAISKGLAILPLRIEEARPHGAMEYALGNTHWLDAFTPPAEVQLERMADAVQALLGQKPSTPSTSGAMAVPASASRRPSYVVPALVAGILVLLGVLGGVLMGRGGRSSSPPTPNTSLGSNPEGAQTVDETAKYQGVWTVSYEHAPMKGDVPREILARRRLEWEIAGHSLTIRQGTSSDATIKGLVLMRVEGGQHLIDFKGRSSEDEPLSWKGVYDFEDGTLSIARSGITDERPAAFPKSMERGVYGVRLQRAGPAGDRPTTKKRTFSKKDKDGAR